MLSQRPNVPFMRLDLPTLLLLRLCIDGFLAALFWTYSRRHASVAGTRWWAAGAAASAISALLATTGVGGRADWNVLNVAGAMTALVLAHAAVWLGLRNYLGLPMRSAVRWTAVGAVLMFLAQSLLLEVWDLPVLRRAVFIAAALALAGLTLLHAQRKGTARTADEFKAFRMLCGVEMTVLAVVLIRLLYTATENPHNLLENGAPYVVLAMILDGLVRAALLSALVAYRLQQNAERDQQKLRDGKADLRALIDNIHAGVIVFNPDQTIETINSAAKRFLNRSEVEHETSQTLEWSLLREDGQPMARHEMPFERVLATGLPLTDMVLGIQPSGEGPVRWTLCNAFAENNHLGGLRHVVLTFVDITSLQTAQREQKALQVALSQSQKMEALGTLAGGVAHDFNNILAAILGNAELARQDVEPEAIAVQSLNEISTAARRGRELVRQILAFSRQQPMERKRVSMRAILAECCGLLKPTIPSQVRLGTACGPGDLSVNADATQLGQVLLNLGTNALHAFEGKPGELTMQVNRFPVGSSLVPASLPKTWLGVIRLQVKDNGCGMDEDTRQRIFEPFFTTRKLGVGTGLGLPVVLGIVERHEGVIDVQSQLGEGTTFNLYFPAAVKDPGEGYVDSGWPQGRALPNASEDDQSKLNGPSQASFGQNATMNTEAIAEKRHVLYLDDDDTLVFLVRRLLERRGYTVTTFTDQQSAIDAVRDQPKAFDLLMTDFNMPGMSGLDVARAVLAINPDLPVAVASGYITDELQAEAVAAGVREVVFKTDAVDDFCNVVAKLVDSKPT
jgi:two-component system, cell cycle sensor histidine kinase and response regulator CckA